ncbi:hypothetical protein RhoFasSB10_00342 [Rhodococcus fascians]|nr:hypothetical protein [Rhodococcus fascians]
MRVLESLVGIARLELTSCTEMPFGFGQTRSSIGTHAAAARRDVVRSSSDLRLSSRNIAFQTRPQLILGGLLGRCFVDDLLEFGICCGKGGVATERIARLCRLRILQCRLCRGHRRLQFGTAVFGQSASLLDVPADVRDGVGQGGYCVPYIVAGVVDSVEQ